MGLSGNIRIQILPPRLIDLVIALLADSIWRAVILPLVVAFKAYSPNAIVLPD
jgi:hypothetical protein